MITEEKLAKVFSNPTAVAYFQLPDASGGRIAGFAVWGWCLTLAEWGQAQGFPMNLKERGTLSCICWLRTLDIDAAWLNATPGFTGLH